MPNAILNPLTHYSGVSGGNYCWLTNNKGAVDTDVISDYWGGVSGTQTKYDPCPAGWRVAPPEAGASIRRGANVTIEKFTPRARRRPMQNLFGRYITLDGGTVKFWFPSRG